MKKAYVVAATFGDSESVVQITGLCAAPSSEVAVTFIVLQAARDGAANDPLMAVNSLEVTADNLRTLLREIEEPSAGPKVVSLVPAEEPRQRFHEWRTAAPGMPHPRCIHCGMWAPDDFPCRGTRDLPPAGEG